MYKMRHVLQLDDDEDAFIISARDLVTPKAIASCPAMMMRVLVCDSASGTATYYEAAEPGYVPEGFEQEFCRDFHDILDGKIDQWRLISVSVYPARLYLRYYSVVASDEASIDLDLDGSRIRMLRLLLETPNSDNSAQSAYELELENANYGKDTSVKTSHPQLHLKRDFYFSEHHPHEIHVTDVYDV